jgi:hypothetical protein
MTRLKRSASKEQQRCGLSVRAFCRQKAISEPSFYAWRKKLQTRDAERTTDGGSNGRLIPVDVIRPTCENAAPSSDEVKTPLEICTPAGFTLRFGHDATPESIARLLDVIARSPVGGTRCATSGATSC